LSIPIVMFSLSALQNWMYRLWVTLTRSKGDYKQKYTNINLIYKKIGSPSVISESLRIRLNHDFKWNEVEILDNEPFYKKRLISEIVYIKKQKHGLNRQIDIEILLDFHIIYTIFTHIVNSISYSFPLHSFSP